MKPENKIMIITYAYSMGNNSKELHTNYDYTIE